MPKSEKEDDPPKCGARWFLNVCERPAGHEGSHEQGKPTPSAAGRPGPYAVWTDVTGEEPET